MAKSNRTGDKFCSNNKLDQLTCKGIGRLNKWNATVFFISLIVPIYADIMENVPLHSSDEFSTHEIIKPVIQHGHNVILSTRMEDGLHASELILSYSYGKNDVIIDLKLNHNLIPHNHFMRYQLPNGTDAIQYFNKTDVDLCHYKGTIRYIEKSRVALSTCNGIEGVIFDGNETYYIDTKHNANISDEHYLYRHSHRIQNQSNDSICAHDKIEIETLKEKLKSGRKIKRSIDDPIKAPSRANKQSLFVEFVLVVDNSMYMHFGRDIKKIHKYCMDITNVVNALYEPLNIFIILVGVSTWNEKDRIYVSSDSDRTLNDFLKHRSEILIMEHPNDNAQLLTNRKFDNYILGHAPLNGMCIHSKSGGVVYNHSTKTSVATTVAHEMGHNFGMYHDSAECRCRSRNCIMEPNSSGKLAEEWSSCSRDQLGLASGRGLLECLRNKPNELSMIPLCGNGFVEPGEQCDCGLPEFCRNSCCDASTCKLKSGASCATGECCDLRTCRLRPAGTVCRPRDGECDLPEYCSGEIEYCPENRYKRDTESCSYGRAHCYKGACRSHANQCRRLWGEYGKSVEKCYDNNVDGTELGNCGRNWSDYSFEKCSAQDAVCGLLQCAYTNDDEAFKRPDVNVRRGYSKHPPYPEDPECQVANFNLGLHNVDPGLSPDGAKCGEGKMCYQQKCRPIERLRTEGIGTDCPENCNGHGTCDNKGHCHCDTGYLPPLCVPNLQNRWDGDTHVSVTTLRTDDIGFDCPENCNGHGTCVSEGYCYCDTGYSPPLCELNLQERLEWDSSGSAISVIGGMRFIYVVHAVVVGVSWQFS